MSEQVPVFHHLFKQSKGQPIPYRGRQVFMYDQIEVAENEILALHLESTNSDWRQGVSLWTDKGHIHVMGKKLKGFSIFEERLAEQLYFRVNARNGLLYTKNIWDIGNGGIFSWYNGAAMYFETTSNGRRYFCNDGRPDDDFDDIIYRIERTQLHIVP